MSRINSDYLLDVGAVTVTTLVGIVVLGRFLDSDLAHKIDDVPLVGDLWIGIRNAVHQVYDPTRAP